MEPSDQVSKSPQPGGGRPDPVPMASLPRKLEEILRLLKDPREDKTVGEIVTLYLEHARTEGLSASGLADKTHVLGLFVQEYGRRPLRDCSPIDLRRFIDAHPTWQSPWTKQRVHRTVQRAFNFAVSTRLIRENPFRGLSVGRGKPRRDIKDGEFRALLRNVPASFRRLLLGLRWTGARPAELASLRWSQIDWDQGIAVLDEHKTAKKTGRPRVIILLPLMVRLLRWIERHPHDPLSPTSAALYELLKDGPLPFRQVARQLRHKGISWNAVRRAVAALGVRYRRLGGGTGLTTYELPAGSVRAPNESPAAQALRAILAEGPLASAEVLGRMRAQGFSRFVTWRMCRDLGVRRRLVDKAHTVMELGGLVLNAPKAPAGCDLVFVNSWGGPWKNTGISWHIRQARARAGLPKDCTLYTIRHGYGTAGVKAGLNLKTLATLMGHTCTATTEHYTHIENDYAHLQDAAQQLQRQGK